MYVQRNPFTTDLHQIIRNNYRQVFFDKEYVGVYLPFHLEREFKKYLTCGILAHGMARFHCSLCQRDKFVAYSCKGRTLCPSCTGRRMADTAKHLVEEVIPEVSVRQWVLSMPYAHRFLLASNSQFLRKSLAIFHRGINHFYLKSAKQLKLKNPKVGAITVVQRFGGALNLNVHFHSLYTDGVFHENDQGDEVFEEIIPSHEDVAKLCRTLKSRLTRAIEAMDADSNESDLAQLQGQRVQNRDEQFKLPTPVGKSGDPPFSEMKASRCHYEDGFSLHASVKILRHQRDALERLCRYVMRGPIALDRISYEESGAVRLKLKTPYADGTTHLEFSAEEFIKRVIALIPPPRQNLIRYIGVFGARHKKREVITSKAKPKDKTGKKKIYRTPWADLLKHVFKYEVNFCDHCGTKLELVACITSTYACQKILRHLGLAAQEVVVMAPRAPPEMDLFDQDYPDF